MIDWLESKSDLSKSPHNAMHSHVLIGTIVHWTRGIQLQGAYSPLYFTDMRGQMLDSLTCARYVVM
jgi:hypothetical protein